MADTYIGLYIHYVFSTKNREPIIAEHVKERIWAFMGGIARENRMKALCIGGIADHVHLLISMPTTISIAKTMQLIKGGTTAWVHDTFPGLQRFAWQEGYAAFSVSESDLGAVVSYINSQEEHHRKKSFQEEYRELLEANGVEYDERPLGLILSGLPRDAFKRPSGTRVVGSAYPAMNRRAIIGRPSGTRSETDIRRPGQRKSMR